MPRTERFGLGVRIDRLFLELLEFLRRAAFAEQKTKLAILGEATLAIDSLRFFLQLSWEVHIISDAHFMPIGSDIEELGRMIGGWRRGLVSKTPAMNTGERRE